MKEALPGQLESMQSFCSRGPIQPNAENGRINRIVETVHVEIKITLSNPSNGTHLMFQLSFFLNIQRFEFHFNHMRATSISQ